MNKILVVDDSHLICQMIEDILKDEEYIHVNSVYSGKEALETIHKHMPDMILLDVILPDIDGYELCRLLKEQWNLTDIPVIFLTSQDDVQSIVRGFNAGAVDYICKPFSPIELKARVLSHLQNKIMSDRLKILEKAKEKIRLQGLTDPLTNIYNRRFFLESVPEWRKLAQKGEQISLLMGDIDNFKSVNDQYGHCAGDYVLYTIADLMVHTVKEKGVVGRWGGEEFLIVLMNTTLEQAGKIAEELRQRIYDYDFCYEEQHIHCSITIGIAQFNKEEDVTHNIDRTDKALYFGKNKGKNCCVMWEKEVKK